MARYIITKSPGVDYPMGHKFSSDDLHPSMLAHVRRIDDGDEGGEDAGEPEAKAEKQTRAPRQQGPGKNT